MLNQISQIELLNQINKNLILNNYLLQCLINLQSCKIYKGDQELQKTEMQLMEIKKYINNLERNQNINYGSTND